jgi:hypothetical protein
VSKHVIIDCALVVLVGSFHFSQSLLQRAGDYQRVICGAIHCAGQLEETGPPWPSTQYSLRRHLSIARTVCQESLLPGLPEFDAMLHVGVGGAAEVVHVRRRQWTALFLIRSSACHSYAIFNNIRFRKRVVAFLKRLAYAFLNTRHKNPTCVLQSTKISDPLLKD